MKFVPLFTTLACSVQLARLLTMLSEKRRKINAEEQRRREERERRRKKEHDRLKKEESDRRKKVGNKIYAIL